MCISISAIVNELITSEPGAFVIVAKKLLVKVNMLCSMLPEEKYGILPENFRKVCS